MTQVLQAKNPRALAKALGSVLERLPVEPEAFKGEAVRITLYRTGKVLVQGKQAEQWTAKLVEKGLAARAEQKGQQRGRGKTARMPKLASRTRIGADEAGKGDYFGPLCVAAVLVEPAQDQWLAELGVQDSKRIAKKRCEELAREIEAHLPCQVAIVEPSEYNARYERLGNLNLLLSEVYAEALGQLAERTGCHYAICDQFGSKKLLETKVKPLGLEVVQFPGGEREIAVAAASVVARAHYLAGLAALEKRFGMELHAGAGAPVIRKGREFVAKYGREALSQVAKVHFRTTQSLLM